MTLINVTTCKEGIVISSDRLEVYTDKKGSVYAVNPDPVIKIIQSESEKISIAMFGSTYFREFTLTGDKGKSSIWDLYNQALMLPTNENRIIHFAKYVMKHNPQIYKENSDKMAGIIIAGYTNDKPTVYAFTLSNHSKNYKRLIWGTDYNRNNVKGVKVDKDGVFEEDECVPVGEDIRYLTKFTGYGSLNFAKCIRAQNHFPTKRFSIITLDEANKFSKFVIESGISEDIAAAENPKCEKDKNPTIGKGIETLIIKP